MQHTQFTVTVNDVNFKKISRNKYEISHFSSQKEYVIVITIMLLYNCTDYKLLNKQLMYHQTTN